MLGTRWPRFDCAALSTKNVAVWSLNFSEVWFPHLQKGKGMSEPTGVDSQVRAAHMDTAAVCLVDGRCLAALDRLQLHFLLPFDISQCIS